MPLYELVVTARCSNPIASANLMRIIAKRVFLEGDKFFFLFFKEETLGMFQ